MLALEHVAVRYSRRPVLRDVSFSVAPGEIVAYLGANGAGKTTTMKVVTGLREPDYGRVLYGGRDVAEDPLGYRRRLGYVPETAEVYPFLSGREYLLLAARLRALPEDGLERRVDELLELLDLGELLARIRALLRRTDTTETGSALTYADLTLDPLTRETRRGSRSFNLTPKEFDLLTYLLRHPRQVIPRERLLQDVWGYDFDGNGNVLEVYVGYLRTKTEAGGEPLLIHTVRGVGYALREET